MFTAPRRPPRCVCDRVFETYESWVGIDCGWAVGSSPSDSFFRSVWIEKESINSVIVSDSPEDLHQRMLVAAALSVNATGEYRALRLSNIRPSLLSQTVATGDDLSSH